MSKNKKIPSPYVSRGGLKLLHALQVFQVKVDESVCLDVGSSTGGFTDCLLQHGAKHVHAVDVGYGQLADKLRKDPRVTVMERTHAYALEPNLFPGPFDVITVDTSFISITKVLPKVVPLLAPSGLILGLIKPNFEVGPGKVGKKGVVRNVEWHVEAIEGVLKSAGSLGLACAGLTFSALKGPEGNIEYWALLKKGTVPILEMKDSPQGIVDEACRVLGMPGKHAPESGVEPPVPEVK